MCIAFGAENNVGATPEKGRTPKERRAAATRRDEVGGGADDATNTEHGEANRINLRQNSLLQISVIINCVPNPFPPIVTPDCR